MAADLFVRILFRSEEYDRSINESRRKTKQFQSDMEKSSGGFQKFGSMATSAAGMVSKLAGGLGLAMGAMEVFDKAINSNAQLQDKYQTLTGTSKMVTDQFFSAIYSGDWTVFNDGIEKAIANAEEYITAYRNTQRMLQSTSTRFERIDALKTQKEAIVEDDTRPLEERKKAQAELDRILIMGAADIRELGDRVKETLNQMIETYAGSSAHINADSPQHLIEDLWNPYSSLRRNLEKYRNVRDMSADTFANSFKSGDLTYYYQRQDAKKEYALYTKEQRQRNDEFLRLIDALTENTYARLEDMFGKINDLNDKAGMWEKDRNGARDEILSAKEELDKAASDAIRKTVSNGGNIIPEGSIMALQKKITDLTTSFQKAADEGTRAGFQKAIDEAEIQLEMMRLRAAGTPVLSGGSVSAPEGRNVTDDINSGYISIKPISSDTIQANYDYADSIGAIGNIMSSVTSLTNEGAAAWISYAANVMQSVAQALPQLSALATKNAAVAVSETVAQTSSLGPFGWLMAAGAVASIIALMMSAPKFANGGIVPGNMFTGDRVPAMLNSGEMILNRTQQGNLFRILNNGGSFSRENVNVMGEVTISGDQMRILLANTERKRSRGR